MAQPGEGGIVKIYTEWTDELRIALARPFPVSAVKWKPGKLTRDKTRALAMAYMDARMPMIRLDRTVGPGGWEDAYRAVQVGADCGVECALTILGVTKCGIGVPSKVEKLKGAYSDALKRAAVKFGIGRYLYAIPSVWCAYDEQKKQLAETPLLPAWAVPGEADEIDPESLPDAEPEEPPTGPPANEAQRYEIKTRIEVMGKPDMGIEDVNKVLAKAGFFPLDEIGATDAEEAIGRLKDKHWINVEKTRRQFWARAKGEAGITGPNAADIVHKALGVEHIDQYLDTLDKTIEALILWVDAGTNPEDGDE